MFKSATFEVLGKQRIVCEGCEQRVERLLNSLEGVRQVRARARTQRIDVLFDAAVLAADTIAERLRKAGYETRLGGAMQNERTFVFCGSVGFRERMLLRQASVMDADNYPCVTHRVGAS